MGHPERKDGQPYQSANPELLTKVNTWHDGMRVRHYVDNNSVKFYIQQNYRRINVFQYIIISLTLVWTIWRITSMYKQLTFVLASFSMWRFLMYITLLHLKLIKRIKECKHNEK